MKTIKLNFARITALRLIWEHLIPAATLFSFLFEAVRGHLTDCVLPALAGHHRQEGLVGISSISGKRIFYGVPVELHIFPAPFSSSALMQKASRQK